MKHLEVDKTDEAGLNSSFCSVDEFLFDNVFDSPYMSGHRRRSNCKKPRLRSRRCLFHSTDEKRRNSKRHDGIQDIIKNIQCSKLIGSGGFGSVYLGKMGNTKVAVKRLHTFTKNVKARNESFRAEVRIMRLSHPNIVRTLASSSENFDEDPFIVMEYAGDRNLLQVINDSTDDLGMTRRIAFSLDIATALEYLHQNCLVHLDLKPANVIVNSRDICKVADFGCSQVVEHGTGIVSPTQRSYLTGTYAYRAPELLKGIAPSTKADTYAFAVTMWQMLSREQPYLGQDQQVVIFAVVSYNLRPMIPEFVMEEDDPVEVSYVDLICQCWEAKPEDRPSASDLVEVFSVWKDNLPDDCDDDRGLFLRVPCEISFECHSSPRPKRLI